MDNGQEETRQLDSKNKGEEAKMENVQEPTRKDK